TVLPSSSSPSCPGHRSGGKLAAHALRYCALLRFARKYCCLSLSHSETYKRPIGLKRSPCRGHFRANAICCSNGQEKPIGSFSGKQMHSGEKCPVSQAGSSKASLRGSNPPTASK